MLPGRKEPAVGGVGSAMGKKHKKHKAEKAEWRSASATTYSGNNSGGRGGAVERGGRPLVLEDVSLSPWLSAGFGIPSWAGSQRRSLRLRG